MFLGGRGKRHQPSDWLGNASFIPVVWCFLGATILPMMIVEGNTKVVIILYVFQYSDMLKKTLQYTNFKYISKDIPLTGFAQC